MKKVLLGFAMFVGIVLLIGLFAAGWARGVYNRAIVLEEGVNASWAQVENVLQRRFDLIPNLVETVRGYASHEREVLTAVTEARASVGRAGSPGERIAAEGELSGALSRLMVVVENYPQLKANQNFIMLQDQLEGTENRISVERGRYNESVMSYNRYIRQFPQNVLAGMFGLETKRFFEATQGAETVPEVRF